MPAKKTVCFFIALLLLSTVACSAVASPDTTVTFRGAGVTIYVTFPKEAHPNSTITHNITITSISPATQLRNFTAVIKAPVSSGWQEIFNSQDTFVQPLTKSYNLTFSLPQEANGTLQCVIYANTSSVDDLAIMLYTTRVNTLTFSEMQSLYDEMLANYTALQEDYATLQNEYDNLWANYTILSDNYTALLSERDELSDQYDAQVATYNGLLEDYTDLSNEWDTLKNDYDSLDVEYNLKTRELGVLQENYDMLNATRNSLLGNYTNLDGNFTQLQTDYVALNQTYTELVANKTDLQNDLDSDKIIMFIFVVAVAVLIAFIVYIKRKQQEPYLVIRKETVSMKSDEKS
jgi:predicted nuclease with TOPRIM domain